jgi:phage FluMu protein Com
MNFLARTLRCAFCLGTGYEIDGLVRRPCPVCEGAGNVDITVGLGQELGECKFCAGTGYYYPQLTKTQCPGCHGIGQIVYTLKLGRRPSECKFCHGNGAYYDGFIKKLCPRCKGLGLTYPKEISAVEASASPQKNRGVTARKPGMEYDIAVSFAGEDRPVVKEYVDALSARDVRVFYDEYEKSELWGEDLYTRLIDVYKNKARYCVIFISRHYAEKLWTNHERKAAQARAFRDNKTYILPVKLDDTQLPGIHETVGYIDLREASLDELVQLTNQKLSQ